MIVRQSDDIGGMIKNLEEDLGEIDLTTEIVDDALKISISGYTSCAYSTAVEIDKKIQAFGHHTIGAHSFETECDGEHGEVWVGQPEAIEAAKLQRLKENASNSLGALPIEHAKTVIAEWMKKNGLGSPAVPIRGSEVRKADSDAAYPLLIESIKKGFSNHKSAITEWESGLHVQLGEETLRLTIEVVENDEEWGTTPLSGMEGEFAQPKELRDHTDVLDAALSGLRHGGLAESISGLTTDGDNHDCEAMFQFRSIGWSVKVRTD